MPRGRYSSLETPEIEHNHYDDNVFHNDVIEANCCDCDALIEKKHGVWCKILTRLHLKKKHKAKTQLVTSPKEGNKKKTGFGKKLRRSFSTKRRKPLLNDVTADDYDEDNDCLVTLDQESAAIPGERYQFRGIAIISDRYRPLEEADCDVNSTMNDSGIQCSSDEESVCSDDVIIVDADNNRMTMGSYIRKQWNGKRAKSTRRSFRRGSGYALKYLQTGFQSQNFVPDASKIAVAFQRNDSTRRRP